MLSVPNHWNESVKVNCQLWKPSVLFSYLFPPYSLLSEMCEKFHLCRWSSSCRDSLSYIVFWKTDLYSWQHIHRRIDLTNLLTIWSILHWQIWLWYTDERLFNWAKPPTKIQSSRCDCSSLLVGWNWAILVHPEDSRKEIMYHIMVIFQL